MPETTLTVYECPLGVGRQITEVAINGKPIPLKTPIAISPGDSIQMRITTADQPRLPSLLFEEE